MFHYIDFQARRLWVNLGGGGTSGLGAVLCRNFLGLLSAERTSRWMALGERNFFSYTR